MLMRALAAALPAIALMVIAPIMPGSSAKAGPALVVDLTSGQVIHSEQATRPWHPASLTKLMTVYVALDAVRRGKLKLQTPLRVSRRAYRMAPSKMGFKPGIEITLENALKIIMVKSANDVSVTIAEGISGSVEGFAAQMNSVARTLGMYESNFVNPNGLHHPAHVSSARDMAILGRALFLHFPRQHELYGIGAIRFGRRVMRNHNGLIGRYPGANGMKTGYVCASGFNVVASATRYGRTVIAVVMGSPSPTVRTFQSMALLDKGFASSRYGGSQLQSLPRSAYRSPPNMRSEICNRTRRRQLINQYMISAAPPVAASTSTFRSYAPAGEMDNAAAFFAADKNKSFAASSRAVTTTTGAAPRLRLPPRARAIPERVYVGRAPGWSGSAVGPDEAKPAVTTNAGTDKKIQTQSASVTDEKAGKPLSLQGARSAKRSKSKATSKKARAKKSTLRRKASLRKKRAIRRAGSRAQRQRGRASRKARASSRSKARARSAKRQRSSGRRSRRR